jgi:glycerol uptake facilitator protein
MIIAFGDSVAAMYILYDPSPCQNAYWGVCISWGMVVTPVIYATGSVSGTHANLAVTLALGLIPYLRVEESGSLLAGPDRDWFCRRRHRLRAVRTGDRSLQNRAASDRRSRRRCGRFLHAARSMRALMDQFILTALLLFGIFAITERYNEMAPMANSGAIMIGLLMAIIGSWMGYLGAWALNPARDFGPRLFAYMAGRDRAVFPSPGNYWWVPIVGPLIGGVLGGGAYQCLTRPFCQRACVRPRLSATACLQPMVS